jgi:hypothetical protein
MRLRADGCRVGDSLFCFCNKKHDEVTKWLPSYGLHICWKKGLRVGNPLSPGRSSGFRNKTYLLITTSPSAW